MKDNSKRYVSTGLGNIPLKDYLDIKSSDAGYGSYGEAYDRGFRVIGYEDVSPESLG